MAHCVACQLPLMVEVESDSDSGSDVEMGESSASTARHGAETVPDDVHLQCGCHYHWQCLIDAYEQAECPNCGRTLWSTSDEGTNQVLCNLNNEGGLQENLDILPLLAEEAYLRHNPRERKAHAFIEFCREGDIDAVIGMLQDDDGDEVSMQDGQLDILRYQDPLGNMQSGLHAAVTAESREIVWLLLLIASELELEKFPTEVLQQANVLGVERPDQRGKVDIRKLRDIEGRSAEDVAVELGGVWMGWQGTGRLVA
ncbi:hypothetical protein EJ06DRAFT_542136 [Trichodelitschia bisporula]|uniref:Uncharacterized protein n=1 Tax=Trichodelitschia bisporula TaxID=703511 RepID=A0A6G1I276_9PEZI|nr:hypothetical protein EJ06DRAFT_542136 [Trichodelitschia bisporula]